jgi:hypothetical protein
MYKRITVDVNSDLDLVFQNLNDMINKIQWNSGDVLDLALKEKDKDGLS